MRTAVCISWSRIVSLALGFRLSPGIVSVLMISVTNGQLLHHTNLVSETDGDTASDLHVSSISRFYNSSPLLKNKTKCQCKHEASALLTHTWYFFTVFSILIPINTFPFLFLFLHFNSINQHLCVPFSWKHSKKNHCCIYTLHAHYWAHNHHPHQCLHHLITSIIQDSVP